MTDVRDETENSKEQREAQPFILCHNRPLATPPIGRTDQEMRLTFEQWAKRQRCDAFCGGAHVGNSLARWVAG